ncbi:MAG: glycosyltransferase family 2 protein [Candidatus Hydrogenedentes bacterium]|nr:glycosyltransferase family 2 protein [Candidatus Hydrogenedentota bacterium]
MKISFVIPVYNERETLRALTEGILEHAAPHECQIIMVDDGSTDGSLDELVQLRDEYPSVEIVRMRGNFGKSTALSAGFAEVEGDLVFTMDSDLQDEPKEIPRFLAKIEEGYDVVAGWKATRFDPWHKVIPSRIYNKFVAWLFDVPLHDVNCGYKLFRREVVEKLEIYGEMHRLIPVLAHYLNYRVTEIPVEHHPRQYGVSKYGLERFVRGAMDVSTMWFLTRYRHRPGHFFGGVGLCLLFLASMSLIASVCVWTMALSTYWMVLAVMAQVFLAAGLIVLCLGLVSELVLHHFIRIDPTIYQVDENTRKE